MNIIDKRVKLETHPAKQPRKRKLSDILYIAIHHSATTSGSAEAYARFHVNKKDWATIGYHYVINKDGSIDWCLNHSVRSNHVGNSNKYALGICLTGDFTKEEPTEEQLQAAADLCMMLIDKYGAIKDIKGHSDFQGYSWKKCPAFDVMRITNRMSAFRK
jgi:N-acetyl-anhydromuramyl-L-alanine amidase AmpD